MPSRRMKLVVVFVRLWLIVVSVPLLPLDARVGGRAEFCLCDCGVDKSACVGDRSLGVRSVGRGW